jgi:hypothetical protein
MERSTALIALAISLALLSLTFVEAAEADSQEIDRAIEKRLSHYNREYPHTRFVHLDGGDDWYSDMVAVMTVLGHDPLALDYQHPPDVAKELMALTIERLKRILMADVVSATAFRPGQGSLIKRKHLCVVTLNPRTFVASDYAATQYMLDINDSTMKKVHPIRYLNHLDHLLFAIDHEVFHCLHSIQYGGIPMTYLPFGGEYHLFQRESAADAYAMAIHLRSRGQVTQYARNITHARALWLFTDSPNRDTFETLREVLIVSPKNLSRMREKELVDWAINITKRTVRPYHKYVHQRAAALKAARTLGMIPELYGEQWRECEKVKADPKLVAHLVNRYRYYYEHLFTAERLALDAPPLIDALER